MLNILEGTEKTTGIKVYKKSEVGALGSGCFHEGESKVQSELGGLKITH